MSPWMTGGTAAVIILGTFALALRTERHRPDDSGFDGGDDWAEFLTTCACTSAAASLPPRAEYCREKDGTGVRGIR
jgi:hypothetical protein